MYITNIKTEKLKIKATQLLFQITVDITKLSHLQSSFQISIYDSQTKVGKIASLISMV